MKANAQILLTAAVVVLFFAPIATNADGFPEWRTDDEESGQEYQQSIDAAIHEDGSWTAVWTDYRLGFPTLYARSFDPAGQPTTEGAPLTGAFGLYSNDLNPLQIGASRMAPTQSGQSILTWREDGGGRGRILAALIEGNALRAGPITVNDEARINTREDPLVEVSGDRALITWTEGTGSLAEVYGQRLDFELGTVGGNFRVYPETTSGHEACRLAPSSSGWVAVWVEFAANGNRQLLAREIAIDGGLPDLPVIVADQTDWNQREPYITPLSGGGTFVTWTTSYAGAVNLYGIALDETLAPSSAAFLIVDEDATTTPRAPTAIESTEGSVLVVWTAGDANAARFYARRVDLPNDPQGEYVIVEDPAPPEGRILVPRGLSLRGGVGESIRIFWYDDREGWDLVYGMAVDPSGLAIGDPVPIEIDGGSASQVLPAATLLSDGRGFVSWADFRTGGMTIYGNALGPTAKPVGAAFRISESTSGSVSVPATNLRDILRNRTAITATTDDRVVTAWSPILPGGRTSIYTQHYEESGFPLGDNILLEGPIFEEAQSWPSLAALPGDRYILVWKDSGSDSKGDILGRIYLSDGSVDSDTIRVIDRRHVGASQEKPSVASTGTGEIIVTWLDDRKGNFDVYAQRLGPTGVKIESNLLISGDEDRPIPQSNPYVVAAPDRYVIVWDDNALAQGFIGGMLVTFPTAKDDADAAEEFRAFTIAPGEPGFKYPRAAMAPDGRFVVTYWDTSLDSARVVAQRFARDASDYGPAYTVTSLGGSIVSIPGSVAADNDSILYAWSDGRDARGWDVRVRKVGWDYGGVITAVTTSRWSVADEGDALVLRWSVPRSLSGSTYRIWRDRIDGADPGPVPNDDALLVAREGVGPVEPGGFDYEYRDRATDSGGTYAYWIEDIGGEFAGPWIGSRAGVEIALDLRALDNPFAKTTRLSWSVPTAATLSLSIFDSSGRRVRQLDSFETHAGTGQWLWDGRDQQGRTVSAGLYWARMLARPGGGRSVKLLHLR